ncbi:hypothetical protein EJ02DRAFT_455129, partial [Clathrospora elynae]
MSFDLDTLFREPFESFSAPRSFDSPSKSSPGYELTEEIWVASVNAEKREKDDGHACAHDSITTLVRERDALKAQAEDHAKMIGRLDRRISSKDAAQSDIPVDAVRRLNRLESEIARLRSENTQLKETITAIEFENINLGNKNDGKSRKLKGAQKKVKNAKDVAEQKEEKAKGAVHDKQRHVSSERKMKKERNGALAASQEQMKINEKLRAELEVEQCGAPHMRDTATNPNNTVAVIPIELDVRRTDFQSLLIVFESNQMSIAESFKVWYKEWKKPKGEMRMVVGAN